MSERYPEGAINKAIEALNLAYSYLREKPVIELELRDVLQRLERAKELHEAQTTPKTRHYGSPIHVQFRGDSW